MLETIREFASERMEASADSYALRHRHAEFFLSFAEEAATHDLRFHPGDWFDRLEQEHDNLRAAFDQPDRPAGAGLRMRLAAALWRFWQMRGHIDEGRRRLEDALGADEHPTAARARALDGAAVMAVEGGDPATAKLRAEEALAIHRAQGDARGIAFSRYMLGGAALEQGQFEAAQELLEESIRAFDELGDDDYAELTRRMLTGTYYDLGDKGRARALHEESLRRARSSDNVELIADLAGTLAEYALEDGLVADALPLLKESLLANRRLGNPLEAGLAVRRAAWTLALAGKAETAARLLSCSEVARQESGFKRSWFGEVKAEELDRIRSQLDEDAFVEAWEQGRKMTPDQAIALALDSLP
jgi:tetratricopeptide (TPR) repeat protein